MFAGQRRDQPGAALRRAAARSPARPGNSAKCACRRRPPPVFHRAVRRRTGESVRAGGSGPDVRSCRRRRATVHQRLDQIEDVGAAHAFGRASRSRDENRQTRQQGAFRLVQEVADQRIVASSDRCRSLPLRPAGAAASGTPRRAAICTGPACDADAASSMASSLRGARRSLQRGALLAAVIDLAAGAAARSLKRCGLHNGSERNHLLAGHPSTSRLVPRIDRLGQRGSGATRSSAPPHDMLAVVHDQQRRSARQVGLDGADRSCALGARQRRVAQDARRADVGAPPSASSIAKMPSGNRSRIATAAS